MLKHLQSLSALSPEELKFRSRVLLAHFDQYSPQELLRGPFLSEFPRFRLGGDHGFDPNQPRVPAGNPDGGQWTKQGHAAGAGPKSAGGRSANDDVPAFLQYAERRRSSQNDASPGGLSKRDLQRIERTRDILSAVLVQVNGKVARSTNLLTAAAYGIRVHKLFADEVRALDLPGIGRKGVEQSFSWDGLVHYGFNGSIRTDVVLRNREGQIIAIFDVKTGNATMRPSTEAKYRLYTKAVPDARLIILHANRGPQ